MSYVYGPHTTTNRFYVLPINYNNKYYKQCNHQLKYEWRHIRKAELHKFDSLTRLPLFFVLDSGFSDRVKVIAYCSLSKIPSCARRCLLEVIVRDDYCYYLNIENMFISTRDHHILSVKFRYTFHKYGINFVKNDVRKRYLNNCSRHTTFSNSKKKLLMSKDAKDMVTREQGRFCEDLNYLRQSYYYYYLYNTDEDDDIYYEDRKDLPCKMYDGPSPPTSNEPYIVTPIHHHPELKEQCVRLINSEWPRSRMARFWSLEASTDSLPIILVLTQIINGTNIVLGHAKLTNVPADSNAAFLESVVVDFRYRGRGIGTYLVTETEQYCRQVLNINNVYLATSGQEVFYAKLGYIFCKAINLFGTNTTRKTNSKKHWMKKVISDWEVDMKETNTPAILRHGVMNSDNHTTAKINELIITIRNVVHLHNFEIEDAVCDSLIQIQSRILPNDQQTF
ncbi:uncharacterized protein LOC131694526 isoform X2 [Topomyia yanbarensis]|uniref:uncharacterized protein LOC131694526 isoform X2 n=1 Tax=Topomyia yanbarensis TaxID=2498891 RepID=UPI00273BBD56|nr:uncharacterized protein LOC131694526 isoform X2 [Topomyia yanbarensis]